MAEIILQSLIVVGLGVMIYLVARALPRVDDSVLEKSARTIGYNRLTLYLEKVDVWLKFFLEKFLRRSHLIILKIDNAVSERLKKLKGVSSKETMFPAEMKEGNGSGEQ
jgi:hypothetical protein